MYIHVKINLVAERRTKQKNKIKNSFKKLLTESSSDDNINLVTDECNKIKTKYEIKFSKKVFKNMLT